MTAKTPLISKTACRSWGPTRACPSTPGPCILATLFLGTLLYIPALGLSPSDLGMALLSKLSSNLLQSLCAHRGTSGHRTCCAGAKDARGLPCSPFLGLLMLPSDLVQYCSDCVSCRFPGMPTGSGNNSGRPPAFSLCHELSGFWFCFVLFGSRQNQVSSHALCPYLGKFPTLAFCGNCPCPAPPSLRKNGPLPVGEGDRCWTNTHPAFVDLRKEHGN